MEHGTFESMEVAIEKKELHSNSQKKAGGWYTKAKLEHQECWTKSFGYNLILTSKSHACRARACMCSGA